MRNLIKVALSCLTLSSSVFSVIACSPHSNINQNIINAHINDSDSNEIDITMGQQNIWNPNLVDAINYKGYDLKENQYYLTTTNNLLQLHLQYKVFSDCPIKITYNKKIYDVDLTNAKNAKWNDNDQKVIQQMDALATKGITFDANVSSDDICDTTTNGKISIKNYLSANYLAPLNKNNNYQIMSFVNDKNYFQPIKINQNSSEQSYQPGSYKFIIFDKTRKEYIGKFPYTVGFKIANYDFNDLNQFITKNNTWLTSLGTTKIKDFLKLLNDLNIGGSSLTNPLLKFLEIFGSTLDEIITNPSVKPYINKILNNYNYFDLKTILQPNVFKIVNGTKFYNINDDYQNLLDQLITILSINISGTNFFAKDFNFNFDSVSIKGFSTVFIHIKQLVYSILPDILHFLNFLKANYQNGNHNLFLIFIQYLFDTIPTQDKDSVVTDYYHDNFSLINHYYDNDNNLKQINILDNDGTSKNIVINNNLENLLFDMLTFENNDSIYKSWCLADSNNTKYLYLSDYALTLDNSAHLHSSLGDFDLSFNSRNYNDITKIVSFQLYSLRHYIFNAIFPDLLDSKVISDPKTSIILQPLLALFNNINLNQDTKCHIKLNNVIHLDYNAIFSQSYYDIDLSNYPLDFTIDHKMACKIALNIFRDALRNIKNDNNNQKFSDDVINSITCNEMTGNIKLQIQQLSDKKWLNVDSNNIVNMLNQKIICGFQIVVENFSFKGSVNLEKQNQIVIKNQNLYFDFTINNLFKN